MVIKGLLAAKVARYTSDGWANSDERVRRSETSRATALKTWSPDSKDTLLKGLEKGRTNQVTKPKPGFSDHMKALHEAHDERVALTLDARKLGRLTAIHHKMARSRAKVAAFLRTKQVVEFVDDVGHHFRSPPEQRLQNRIRQLRDLLASSDGAIPDELKRDCGEHAVFYSESYRWGLRWQGDGWCRGAR